MLSVPPNSAAAILTILIGWVADRTRQRGLCNIAVCFLGIAGFSMLLRSDKAGVSDLYLLAIPSFLLTVVSLSCLTFVGVTLALY
jgi:hypothetical protein